MREIKFQFWHLEKRKMSPTLGIGAVYQYLYNFWGVFDWSDVEKRQYTGLKDKNGKEIYEGDVLRFERSSETQIARVLWGGQGWDLFPQLSDCPAGVFGGVWRCDFKVIGNIYENQQLLEEKK